MSGVRLTLLGILVPILVYAESVLDPLRDLLRAQPDLMPGLMLYAWLNFGPGWILAFAIWAGLCTCGVSQTPFAVTVLPLVVTGVLVFANRSVLVRELVPTQVILGFVAGAAVTLFQWVMLASAGYKFGTVWQVVWPAFVSGLGSGLFAPAVWALLERLGAALAYREQTRPSFRPDREILRGRQ